MADFRLLLPDGQGIIGSLDDRGHLTFVILAGENSPIRGTEMFDLMMRAFGEKVLGICGVWRKGHQGQPSVNLDKINELTGSGVRLEEAVLRTWTVTRASRWSYSKVTIIGIPDGIPGDFRKIDVLLEKAEDST